MPVNACNPVAVSFGKPQQGSQRIVLPNMSFPNRLFE